PTLDAEKDSLKAILSSADVSVEEKKMAEKRAEIIDSAQKNSAYKNSTCDEIIAQFETMINDFITKGKEADYQAFLNLQGDAFFIDCRKQDDFARRIRDGVAKVNKYLDEKEAANEK